jgi:uncharacterized membrane protein YfcA
VADARRQPGLTQVLLVAAAVVGVVLGAAALTSLLPVEIQRVIFRGPVLIGVLIVGTGWLLWRISRPRPAEDAGATDPDADSVAPAAADGADPDTEPRS